MRPNRTLTLAAIVFAFTATTAARGSAQQSSPFAGKTPLQVATASARISIDRSVASSTGRTYVRVRGTERGGFVDPRLASSGRLSNGTWVYLVSLDSGGSAGIMNVLVFDARGRVTRLAGAIDSDGGHVGATIVHGRIEARVPIYGANDPNCCPSRLRTSHYTVLGGKLARLDERTTALPKP